MLPRADVRERLLGATSIEALPQGALVGTSSPRRAAQLKALRPDLRTEILRGNVATRMAKVESGAVDATLLAAAGLDRLGVAAGHLVPLDEMLPASAQGAVGITAREGDESAARLLAAIDDALTHEAVLLERGFLAALGGTCHSPVAALARIAGDIVHFRGEILAEDGSERLAGELSVPRAHAADEVAALALRLLGDASETVRGLFS
jgi:hydroxymethylbilane synthase